MEHAVVIEELILAPGERADVVIDFSCHEGKKIILTNDAPSPFPDGDIPSPDLNQIMQFCVDKNRCKKDHSTIPDTLSSIETLDPENAITTRANTLIESTDDFGRLLLLLNNLRWDEMPIKNTPYNGTMEVWELFNTTVDTHPIHLHLVQFQILNRAPFAINPNDNSFMVGDPIPPDPNEAGWKDTVRANPGQVTRIIARFGPFTGVYPWHCHILEHEDHDMMRPYEVIDNPQFNPCDQLISECPDDSFAQCCEEEKRNKKKKHKHKHKDCD